MMTLMSLVYLSLLAGISRLMLCTHRYDTTMGEVMFCLTADFLCCRCRARIC